MVRTLLVNEVHYAGVVLPAETTVVITVRRDDAGRTAWEAAITLPGNVALPDSGEFWGSADSRRFAGTAVLTRCETAEDKYGVHTAVAWEGTGDVTLPE